MRFKRGQIVKGNPKSTYYGQSIGPNGENTGVIVATHNDNPHDYDIMRAFEYLVLWHWEHEDKTPHFNYDGKDLILAEVDDNQEGLQFLKSSQPF